MTRIQRQLTLPEGFWEWSDKSKLSHLLSVRSRILQWHRRDNDHRKFGLLFSKMEWVWWTFTVATFAGFAELALGMLLEGMAAAFIFMMGMMAQEFYEGWK